MAARPRPAARVARRGGARPTRARARGGRSCRRGQRPWTRSASPHSPVPHTILGALRAARIAVAAPSDESDEPDGERDAFDEPLRVRARPYSERGGGRGAACPRPACQAGGGRGARRHRGGERASAAGGARRGSRAPARDRERPRRRPAPRRTTLELKVAVARCRVAAARRRAAVARRRVAAAARARRLARQTPRERAPAAAPPVPPALGRRRRNLRPPTRSSPRASRGAALRWTRATTCSTR